MSLGLRRSGLGAGISGLGKLWLFLGGLGALLSACSHQVKDEERAKPYDYLEEIIDELIPEPVYVDSDEDGSGQESRAGLSDTQDDKTADYYRMQSCRKGYVQGKKSGRYVFVNRSECFVLSSINVDGVGNPLNGTSVRAIGFRSRRGAFKDWYPIPARIEDGALLNDQAYAEKVLAFVKKDREGRIEAKNLLAEDILSDHAIKRYKRDLDDYRMLPTLAYEFANNEAVFLFDGEHEMKHERSFIAEGDVFLLHLDGNTRNVRVYRLNKGKQDTADIGNWHIDIDNKKMRYTGTGET